MDSHFQNSAGIFLIVQFHKAKTVSWAPTTRLTNDRDYGATLAVSLYAIDACLGKARGHACLQSRAFAHVPKIERHAEVRQQCDDDTDIAGGRVRVVVEDVAQSCIEFPYGEPAALLCGNLDFSAELCADHAAYIDSWLRILKGDSTAIFKATSAAIRSNQYARD